MLEVKWQETQGRHEVDSLGAEGLRAQELTEGEASVPGWPAASGRTPERWWDGNWRVAGTAAIERRHPRSRRRGRAPAMGDDGATPGAPVQLGPHAPGAPKGAKSDAPELSRSTVVEARYGQAERARRQRPEPATGPCGVSNAPDQMPRTLRDAAVPVLAWALSE